MKIFLAGGAVRDELLGLPRQDRDFIALDASEEDMLARGFVKVGQSHDVFIHPQTGHEYTLAPNGLKQELKRRDLTVNSIAKNVETNELYDPFNGRQDLQNKILRHTSDSFADDPVRIARLARFQARFPDFSIAKETQRLCATLCQNKELFAGVPGERFFGEIKKALGLPDPGPFFEKLLEWKALDLFFPELAKLKGVPQNPAYHPEGDCWTHSMLVLKSACRLSEDISVRFACLVHDLGKGETPQEEWPKHIMHEKRGIRPVQNVCERFKTDAFTRRLSLTVCRHHLNIHRAFELKASTLLRLLKNLNALREGELFEKALLCCQADDFGKLRTEYPQREFLLSLAKVLNEADYSDLIKNFKGKELGEKIEQEQIRLIQGVKRQQKGRSV